MDHFNDIARSSSLLMPLVVLLVGFMGSLHCTLMCGPLIMASAQSNIKNHAHYQLGRLLSYLGLGALSGLASEWFLLQQENSFITLIPTLLLSLMLLYWGASLFTKKNKTPALLSKIYSKLSIKAPFAIGLFSILLPCGFLYGMVMTLATFQSLPLALIGMISFWLATLPALSGASWLALRLQKIPFRAKHQALALILIGIGISSLSWRFYQFYSTGSCH